MIFLKRLFPASPKPKATSKRRTIKQGEVIPATGETTPDEPDDGEVCPFCGKVHTGRFAKWIKIVHRVFAFLLDVFNIVKK